MKGQGYLAFEIIYVRPIRCLPCDFWVVRTSTQRPEQHRSSDELVMDSNNPPKWRMCCAAEVWVEPIQKPHIQVIYTKSEDPAASNLYIFAVNDWIHWWPLHDCETLKYLWSFSTFSLSHTSLNFRHLVITTKQETMWSYPRLSGSVAR